MKKKICSISDTHGDLPEIPECDILCICGDILPLYIQNDYPHSIAWLAGPFQKWALEAPCKHVVMIWGNHDFIGEKLHKHGYKCDEEIIWGDGMHTSQMHEFLFQNDNEGKIHILLDDFEDIDEIRIHGTSWCPELKNWAFYADSETLKRKFEKIPFNFDILLTHCPPKFGQQGVVLETNYNFGRNFGCEELQNIIERKTNCRKDKCYILSGHIHSGNHNWETNGICNYCNTSIKNENYEIVYKPLVFEIETLK